MSSDAPSAPLRLSVRWAVGASVLGLVAWSAGQFQGRSPLPSTGPQAGAVLLWAGLLGLVLWVAERLSSKRPFEVGAVLAPCGLLAVSVVTLMWYLNGNRVGPLDAQWYQGMTIDYLTQARSGVFPVVVGATQYAFNGAVHPFRSAPWQFVLADGIDLLTGRCLRPVAVEHLSAILSYLAAVLGLYVGLARSRGASRPVAFLFTLAYATTPALTVPLFQYDMYMTLVAQPAMIGTLLCAQRLIDDEAWGAATWFGVCLAALWYCHPPMALLTGLVAGAGVAAAFAVRGLSARRGAVLAVSGVIFAALAGPYFWSMAEIHSGASMAGTAKAGAGLALMIGCAAGFLRSRHWSWLLGAVVALGLTWWIQPALVPFLGCFLGWVVLCARFARQAERRLDLVRLIGCAVAAALVAFVLYPAAAQPGPELAPELARIQGIWSRLFRPISHVDGTLVQPGWPIWILLVLAVGFAGYARSLFAHAAAAASLMLVVALGVCGIFSRFLWTEMPRGIIDVLGVGYDLRLVPVLAVVGVIGGFHWYASLPSESRLRRITVVALLVLLPWAGWEQGFMLFNIRDYHLDRDQTEVRNRLENVALERYSWDLLNPPRYMNYGVMDPALETRFWADLKASAPTIGPDEIERALEEPGQKMEPITGVPIPTGRAWLTLSRTVELEPGQHVLLRFDFLGGQPRGFLIVKGQTIYREYQMPSSGRDYAFGAAPGNTRVLSLWNSGTTHESIQLLVLRTGPDALAEPASPYCLLAVTPYVPEKALIELYSLIPLHLRVTVPTAGYVESFRSLIPGYKAYVDDRPVAVVKSNSDLVMVPVPAGTHDIHIRFAGTVGFHTAIRVALTLWTLAAVVAFLQLAMLCRRPAGSAEA